MCIKYQPGPIQHPMNLEQKHILQSEKKLSHCAMPESLNLQVIQ